MSNQPTDSSSNDNEHLRDDLIAHISGFKPAMTGTLCDSCNRGLSEGDTVQVMADYYADADEWSLIRTHCQQCDAGLSTLGLSAVVECELGYSNTPEFKPLYNPKIVEFGRDTTEDEL